MENIEKRLSEINGRKLEIRAALKSGEEINLQDIETELNNLEEEEKELRSKIEIANKINTNKIETRKIEKPESKDVNTNMFDTLEYRNAFRDYVTTGKAIPAEYRTTTTSNAGAVIPTTTANQIVDKLALYGNLLPLVSKTHYNTGVSLPVSNIVHTAQWVDETVAAGTSRYAAQNTNIGSIVFGAYKLRLSFALSLHVQVMAIDAFESWLADQLAKGIAIALENSIISGTGVDQPTGILTAAADTATAATIAAEGRSISASAIDYDTLLGMEGALPAQYDATSVYVLPKRTFLSLRGVKDTNKMPVVQNLDVMNKELLGRKVVLVDNANLKAFDTASTGDICGFIFDPTEYFINTAYELNLRKYFDEGTDEEVLKAIQLVDGKPVRMDSYVQLVKA